MLAYLLHTLNAWAQDGDNPALDVDIDIIVDVCSFPSGPGPLSIIIVIPLAIFILGRLFLVSHAEKQAVKYFQAKKQHWFYSDDNILAKKRSVALSFFLAVLGFVGSVAFITNICFPQNYIIISGVLLVIAFIYLIFSFMGR